MIHSLRTTGDDVRVCGSLRSVALRAAGAHRVDDAARHLTERAGMRAPPMRLAATGCAHERGMVVVAMLGLCAGRLAARCLRKARAQI